MPAIERKGRESGSGSQPPRFAGLAVWCIGLPATAAPSGLRALPANLCPGLAGTEALCDGDDFCESVGESVEARAGGAVWQGAAEHLQHMVRAR